MKQFSVRELLVGIAFVAIALGWWNVRRHRPAEPARRQLTVINGSAIIVDTATGETCKSTQPNVPAKYGR